MALGRRTYRHNNGECLLDSDEIGRSQSREQKRLTLSRNLGAVWQCSRARS